MPLSANGLLIIKVEVSVLAKAHTLTNIEARRHRDLHP